MRPLFPRRPVPVGLAGQVEPDGQAEQLSICGRFLCRIGPMAITLMVLIFGLMACSDPRQQAFQVQSTYEAPAPASSRPDAPLGAEAVLLELYEDAVAGRHQQALDRARQLTLQFPHFQLGQMLYAELLNLSLDQPFDPASVGAAADAKNKVPERMNLLLDELKQRRKSLSPVAPPGWTPRNFVHLSSDQRYAVAVDVSRSRLYLLAQQGEPLEDGEPRFSVVADMYITAGLNGIGKQVEGDGKTPEGVYFVGKSPPNRVLPDLYGSGALMLNYPNALDLRRGKTGSGIWLHGTPQLQYSRPPLDSDGCIVLSNLEMKRLIDLPGLRGAPIVISAKLEWTAPSSLKADREAFSSTLARWHSAWQAGQEPAIKTLYSPSFERNGKNLGYWWPELAARAKTRPPALNTQVKSILRWTDQDDHMIVTLQDNSNEKALWRLYWVKAGADWQIVYEGPASSP